jgi:hypothetical protein
MSKAGPFYGSNEPVEGPEALRSVSGRQAA